MSGVGTGRDRPATWRDDFLDAAPLGMAVVAPDTTVIEASPRFAALVGVAPPRLVGAKLASLFGPEAHELLRCVDAVLVHSRTSADAELRVGGPGERRWLLATCFPITHGGGPAVGVTLLDISERREREERHETLQKLAAAFAAAVTADVVADLVIRTVLESVDAIGGALYLLDESGTRLTTIVSKYPPLASQLLDVDVDDDLPVCLAVRSRSPVYVGDSAELGWRFPRLTERIPVEPPWGAHAALPLTQGARVLGALIVSWPSPRRFTPDERDFLRGIADECAKALHRSEVMRAERDAREHIERVADQVLRLERITGALASASAPDEVIDRFLDDCLDEIDASDGGVMVVDHTAGVLVSAGGHAQQPRRVLPLDGPTALATAVRTRQTVLLENLEQIRAYTGDDLSHITDEQGWALVPLLAYDEMLGALWLRYDGGRRFDADDRAFLERVGRRLGEALERSRLYAEQRAAREQAEAAARWLRSVQGMAAALARSATRRDVARALREHLHPATRADYSIVAALSHGQQTMEVLTGTSTFALSTSELDTSVRSAVRDSLMRGRAIELSGEDEVRPLFPMLHAAGIRSFALLPIRSGRNLVGAIGIGWSRPDGLTAEARRLLAIAVSLGGSAFERAAAYDLDHHIAETLQRHLLTAPDITMPELAWAARYAPGAEDLTAGGDWYDVIELGGGRVGLVVGDIVGHGIMAAAAMGQLRSATRALAPRESPVGVLEALDAFVNATGQGSLSSLAYVVIDPIASTTEYAVAGHPPPLVRRPDGSVELVHEARGRLLGMTTATPRTSVVRPFEPGSTIVLYTDGLIERRGESIDVGLGNLAALVRETPVTVHPEAVCDRLLRRFTSAGAAPDDITVLAVQLEPYGTELRRSYPARLEMLRVIRRDTRAWLDANGIDQEHAADIVLACGEACANAIEHGAAGASDDLLDVSLTLRDGDVVATVRDNGRWREEERGEERGRGLQIIRAVMDGVEVSTGDDGTTVVMRSACSAR